YKSRTNTGEVLAMRRRQILRPALVWLTRSLQSSWSEADSASSITVSRIEATRRTWEKIIRSSSTLISLSRIRDIRSAPVRHSPHVLRRVLEARRYSKVDSRVYPSYLPRSTRLACSCGEFNLIIKRRTL